MPTTNIYALCEPGTLTVRYVGRTSNTLSKRLAGHLSSARQLSSTRKNRDVVVWINQLLVQGTRPDIILLTKCHAELADETERNWMAVFVRNGYSLENYGASTEARRQEKEEEPEFANPREWLDYECKKMARKRGITVEEARRRWQAAIAQVSASQRQDGQP